MILLLSKNICTHSTEVPRLYTTERAPLPSEAPQNTGPERVNRLPSFTQLLVNYNHPLIARKTFLSAKAGYYIVFAQALRRRVGGVISKVLCLVCQPVRILPGVMGRLSHSQLRTMARKATFDVSSR